MRAFANLAGRHCRQPQQTFSVVEVCLRHFSSTSAEKSYSEKTKDMRWLALPPFEPTINPVVVAKKIVGRSTESKIEKKFDAFKWVRRCCPSLPVALVHKLFRLRQVRKDLGASGAWTEMQAEKQLKRVSAKDVINSGEVLLLPARIQEFTDDKDGYNNEQKTHFIRSLVLHKDSAIIVINKPPGLPVQGGVGVKYSIDTLASTSLRYNTSESPMLVHRLDRDCSGVLVLGRTQTSASILHTIFREKTSGAFADDMKSNQRPLQRKYWALVIGTPKQLKGLISAPLGKVVLDDGKSERIIVVDKTRSTPAQHALTEYEVIGTSPNGYTWLEMSPLTGRKHQLRVHCAEVLQTPIVGDYKYGWNAHKRGNSTALANNRDPKGKHTLQEHPFGLKLGGGSITDKKHGLHLHCRQMIIPNISVALEHLQLPSIEVDLSKLEKLNLVAPLPLHMEKSWELLGYSI